MKARVESDGTPGGTHVIDQDGKEILGWSKVTISVGNRGVTRAFVEFSAVDLKVTDAELSTSTQGNKS